MVNVLAGCGLLGGSTDDPTPSPTSGAEVSNLPKSEADFIDAVVAQVTANDGIPGTTVSYTAPGKTFLRNYGSADTTTQRKPSANDHFRIGGVTNTFVATAVLRLIEQGSASMDATIEQYVPGVPKGTAITLKQLLGMQSGVFNYMNDAEFMSAYKADPLLPDWKPEDIIPILQRHEPAFEPGARAEYSPSNYVLLGLALNNITHRGAEQVIQDYVVQPLGVGIGTTFPATPPLIDPFIRGYDEDSLDVTSSNPQVPWTSGGMVSTVTELTRYAKLLAEGALLTPATQAERMKATPLASSPGGPFVGYGLGISVIGDWVGHTGAIFGYGTAVYYLPQSQATIVVMTNKATPTQESSGSLFLTLAQHFYPPSLHP